MQICRRPQAIMASLKSKTQSQLPESKAHTECLQASSSESGQKASSAGASADTDLSHESKGPSLPKLTGRRVITFGTYDLLHVGHLRLLERARACGDVLIVGVSTDALNVQKKGRLPVFPQEQRLRLVGALRCVDHVFYEETLELKQSYIEEYGADVLVMGDDWAGRFDDMPCACTYLPRTPSISTTEIIEVIKCGAEGQHATSFLSDGSVPGASAEGTDVVVLSHSCVITFGTFDLLHVGHLNLLERARTMGSSLVVGVSTDALNIKKKGRSPIFPEKQRLRLISALKCVDHVFLEETLELKPQYIQDHGADLLVMGDDWEGHFDAMPCECLYLPRTPSISTTEIIEVIVDPGDGAPRILSIVN